MLLEHPRRRSEVDPISWTFYWVGSHDNLTVLISRRRVFAKISANTSRVLEQSTHGQESACLYSLIPSPRGVKQRPAGVSPVQLPCGPLLAGVSGPGWWRVPRSGPRRPISGGPPQTWPGCVDKLPWQRQLNPNGSRAVARVPGAQRQPVGQKKQPPTVP